jgi:hypothetical protein
MANKTKRMKGKLLFEAYTPSGADEDGYSDGIAFEQVVGNRRFHSFQVWREKAGGRATCVYGLSIKQIEAIIEQKQSSLIDEVKSLKKLLQAAQRRGEKLDSLNQRQQASGLTEDAMQKLSDELVKLREENRGLNDYFRDQGRRQSERNRVAYARRGYLISVPTGGKAR